MALNTYGGIALEWVFDAENIDVALVKKMMKHINGLNCGRSLLFEAENPAKNQKIGTHTVILQYWNIKKGPL